MSVRGAITKTLRRMAEAMEPASASSRRWPSWALATAPARQQLATRWRDSARGNWLASTSPSAAAITELWATSLVGDGPSVRAGHPDPAMRATLEDAFAEWSESVDVEQMHDLAGFTLAGVRSLVRSGESVVHLVTTGRGELRLRLLSPEQLDPSLSRETENLQRVVAGVEYDAMGRRIAYYIFPRQPDLLVTTMQWAPVRISADDIAHVFVSNVPGQVRGSSWLAPVSTRLEALDRLEDALGERFNVACLFAAFVTDPSGTSGLGDGAIDPQRLTLEPGIVRVLPPDATVSFPDLPTTEGAPDFLRHTLRQIAAGVGMPYELLTGDFSATTYSAGKMALENFRRRVRSIRATLLDARFLRLVWARWVTLEVLSGRLAAPGFDRDPTPFLKVQYLWPEFASLEPYREAQADVALLNAGVRSRAEVIASRGRDISDVDREIAADSFIPRAGPAQSLQGAIDNASSP